MERERNNHIAPQETMTLETYVGMYLGKTGVPVCSKEEVRDAPNPTLTALYPNNTLL